MLADTAIVRNGTFTHYCHEAKGLMMLRVHHIGCPLCGQKNPEHIPNKLIHIVCKFNGTVVLGFADENKAIRYIQEHPFENLMLNDTGYVD